MNKTYKTKTKKITLLCVLLALAFLLSSMLYSCDKKPDIYVLIENILQNKDLNAKAPNGLYSFNADFNIKINKDYLIKEGILLGFAKQLDSVPDELTFKIDGKVKNSGKDLKQNKFNEFAVNFALVLPEGENQNLKTTIYKKDNLLYFELNDISRIVLDFLCSTGFVDIPVKNLFSDQVELDDGSVLCFDLTGFDLSMFNEYIEFVSKAFTLKSSVRYNLAETVKDFDVPGFDEIIKPKETDEKNGQDGKNEAKVFYFNDIKKKINKELLKKPYYRYVELYAVIETDENKDSFLHILATRESGEMKVLEKIKLDCDVSKIREDDTLLYNENIVPMRYMLELFGETVEWDSDKKQAYIISAEGKNVYLEGKLIESTYYINLTQFLLKTNYDVGSVVSDEYIEFRLNRK